MQFMGIVHEVGPKVKNFKKGDRVISSFEMGCGHCFYCQHQLFSGCATTNPSEIQANLYGQQTAGMHGMLADLMQPTHGNLHVPSTRAVSRRLLCSGSICMVLCGVRASTCFGSKLDPYSAPILWLPHDKSPECFEHDEDSCQVRMQQLTGVLLACADY